jgi:soluble lytic murein transglycosylase-like protein
MPLLLLLVPIAIAFVFVRSRASSSSSSAVDQGGDDGTFAPVVDYSAGAELELAEPYDPATPLFAFEPVALAGGGIVQGIERGIEAVSSSVKKLFTLPTRAEQYRTPIAQAEAKYGIPESLLARLLHQESRFRPEIINGSTVSSAGAQGIAQFMPGTARELEIDPLNVNQSIDAAAKYLRRQFDRFGAWSDALGAYNWGPGNWNSYLNTGRGARGQVRPLENVNYVSQILNDVEV